MRVPIDALISALTYPTLYLSGDEDGGVGLHCQHHHDGGRPPRLLRQGRQHLPDPEVANVATIPGLWAHAVDHLAAHHREE